MADISKVSIDGGLTEYDISDDVARARLEDVEDVIPSAATSSNKLVDQASVNTALSGKVDNSSVGANNGVASLDSTGKVPSTQLPSYVDDVLEFDSVSVFPVTGETGKIYVAKDTNKIYRWSGSNYVDVTGASAWGEIRGDLSNQTDLSDELNAKSTLNQLRGTIGYVGVNDMPFPYDFTEITQDGITFKVESDGTITLSGRATANTTITLAQVIGKDSYARYAGLLKTEKSTYGYITTNTNITMLYSNQSINFNSISEVPFELNTSYTISIRVMRYTDLTNKVLNLQPVLLLCKPLINQFEGLEEVCYRTDLTNASSLDDTDKIPCYLGNTMSLDPRRNVRFSTIKETLKDYFDNHYISATVDNETLILG